MKTLRFILPFFFLFLPPALFAAAERHNGAVNALVFTNEALYSAGKDGFVIKQTAAGAEAWQFTHLAIKFMAVNPVNGDIALYETDGFTIHRISVWNWTTKTRKFIKVFADEILSLNYSARGTYLILGAVTMQGAAFLNAQTGAAVPLVTGSTGMLTFAVTNAAETSLVTYTATGTLAYYDLRTKKLKASFQTETNLQNIVLFKNNLILAGVKGNTIYQIDALSGSVLKKNQAASPALVMTADDDQLSYLAKTAGGGYGRFEETENGLEQRQGGLPGTIVCAAKGGGSLFAGTADGRVFRSDGADFTEITRRTRKPVLDMCAGAETAYFITEDAYYQADLRTETVRKITAISGFTDILACPGGVILWARGTAKPFTFIPDDNIFFRETLYSPTRPLQFAAMNGRYLVFIEGNSLAGVYDTQARQLEGLRTGSGFQAVAMAADAVYVAKTAATNPKTPLVSINIETGETVAELKNSTADAAYALQADRHLLYGISTRLSGADKKTDIFSYNTQNRTMRTVLTLSDEDVNAHLVFYKGFLYTTLGKTQISIVDAARNTVQRLSRGSALPVKTAPSDLFTLVLNTDGTVSVYDGKTRALIAVWAVLENGDCAVL